MSRATLLHVAVALVAACCLAVSDLAYVGGSLFHTGPQEVVEYGLAGPPELILAARWRRPLVLVTLPCGVGALALAIIALDRRYRTGPANPRPGEASNAPRPGAAGSPSDPPFGGAA